MPRSRSRDCSPAHRFYLVLNDGGMMWLIKFVQSNDSVTPVVTEFDEGETTAAALMKALCWSLPNRRLDNAFRVCIGDHFAEEDDETQALIRALKAEPSWLDRFNLHQLNEHPRSA